jgi:hypothetical protein
MVIREFSKSWKLNFCKGERKLVNWSKSKEYTRVNNMSDKALIYRLNGLPLGQGGLGCMVQAPT